MSHVFQSAGLHKVTATATDSLGLVGPAVILDVSVSSLPFPPPRVTVIGVHWQTVKLRKKKTERVLDVSFSGALEPTPAQDLSDFHLAALGKAKKSGVRATKPVALKSAVYSPATNTVTLLPRKSVPNQTLQLTIVASEVLDALGRPIEANQGVNFAATFGQRGISLARSSDFQPVTRVRAAAFNALVLGDR